MALLIVTNVVLPGLVVLSALSCGSGSGCGSGSCCGSGSGSEAVHSSGISPSSGQGSHSGSSSIYIPGGQLSGITAQNPDSPLVSPSGQGPRVESHSPVVGSKAKSGGHPSIAGAA